MEKSDQASAWGRKFISNFYLFGLGYDGDI